MVGDFSEIERELGKSKAVSNSKEIPTTGFAPMSRIKKIGVRTKSNSQILKSLYLSTLPYFIGENGTVLKNTASTFSTILPDSSEASRAFIQSGSTLNRSKAALKASLES